LLRELAVIRDGAFDPVTSAVVIAFGSRGEDTESGRFGLEMCRAAQVLPQRPS
jgi:hypothetical protein